MIVQLLFILLASASISYTIACSSIFLWLRDWLGSKRQKWDEFINCPWCIGHWIVFILLLLTTILQDAVPFIEITLIPAMDFCITWFAMTAIMGIVLYFICNAFDKGNSFFRTLEWKQKTKENEKNN